MRFFMCRRIRGETRTEVHALLVSRQCDINPLVAEGEEEKRRTDVKKKETVDWEDHEAIDSC